MLDMFCQPYAISKECICEQKVSDIDNEGVHMQIKA